MHSWRIYLACALYAAGCPNDRIQAILRWKSDEALLIYARLNDSERNDWLSKARSARVDSKGVGLPAGPGCHYSQLFASHYLTQRPRLSGYVVIC